MRRKSLTIVKAVSSVPIEGLEERRLFSTYSYTVPTGHSSAYLEPDAAIIGAVEVHLDSATGTLAHTFTNTAGQDVIECGSTTGFTFVNQVAAALMPGDDGSGDQGIKVVGGTGSTLEVDATNNDDDQYFTIPSSGSTFGTVSVYDPTDDVAGLSSYGAGINKLKLVTNDNTSAASFYDHDSNTGDGTTVYVPIKYIDLDVEIDADGTYDKLQLGAGSNAHANFW